MIEDYVGIRSFARVFEVVIPKHEWNPPGVYASGYQLVPVLVYHNIGDAKKGSPEASRRAPSRRRCATSKQKATAPSD
jgi:hypothetical protein